MTKNVEWSYIHAARGCQELVLIFRAQIGNLTLKSRTLLSSKYGHIPKLPKTKKITNEKWPYICALLPTKRIFWYLIIGISYSVSMFKKRYITRFFQNGPTCYWFYKPWLRQRYPGNWWTIICRVAFYMTCTESRTSIDENNVFRGKHAPPFMLQQWTINCSTYYIPYQLWW